jgi:hypothetical protein
LVAFLVLVLVPVASFGGFLVCLDGLELEAAEYKRDEDPADLAGPPKDFKWDDPPAVIVCEDSMVSRKQIEAAMRFWEERGHRFGELYFHKDPRALCFSRRPDRYIVVRVATAEVKDDADFDILAETHFYVTYSGNIMHWAKVFMIESPRELVMEHELGHALGFSHYNVAGHLMHARTTRGGWDDFGLDHMTPEVRAEWERTATRPGKN